MSMTDYIPITPLGEGSTEIEAFGSFFCRLARVHSVSVYALTRHLRTWWQIGHPNDTRAKINVVNAMNPMLCGIGPNVGIYVSIVSEAVGCQTVERATFLPLRAAISQNGHGVVRRGRAWCPACLEEAVKSNAMFYDRLIWAMPVITRCLEHEVQLVRHCPKCGASQAHYHHLGYVDHCYKCKQLMRSLPSEWKRAFHPVLYEKEAVDLVREISSGNLKVVEEAYGIFIKDFSDCMSTVGKKISRHAYKAPRRPQRARENVKPRLLTLMKRCAAFGIDPTDVLRDPSGAAMAASTLEFARLNLPTVAKPRRPADLIALATERIEKELVKTGEESFPSLQAIADELGVSKGFLSYRLKDLIHKYTKYRHECRIQIYIKHREKALDYLRSGPIAQYPSRRFPSHDHLVAATVKRTGIGVREARIAVDAALKEKYGRRPFERYKRANNKPESVALPSR
jgi:hypothetical protein